MISVDTATNNFTKLEVPNQHGTNQNWLDIISYPLAANTYLGTIYNHRWFPHVAVICPDNTYRFWNDIDLLSFSTRPDAMDELLDETMSCLCRKPECDDTYCDGNGGDADGDSICDDWVCSLSLSFSLSLFHFSPRILWIHSQMHMQDPDVQLPPTPPDTDTDAGAGASSSSSSGSGSSTSTTMIAVVCVVVGVIAAVGVFILIQRNKGKHSYQQKILHEDDVHLEVGEGR